MHCGADCTKKDRNGLTPLELTVKKKQLKTEWALRKLTFKGSLAVALSLGMKRLRDPTILMFMVFGSDDWEMHVWAWRIVFVSNLLGSLTTFFVFAMSEAMGNLSTLHLVNTMAQLLWWVSFTLCLQRAPSFVRETTTMGSGDRATGTGIDSSTGSDVTKVDVSARNLRAYAIVLDAIGRCVSERDANAYPSLCHTCKVVRPLRSKHCKMLRRCVRRVSAHAIIALSLSLFSFRCSYFYHDPPLFFCGLRSSTTSGEQGLRRERVLCWPYPYSNLPFPSPVVLVPARLLAIR
jgi:hypothetical protein